MKKTKCLLALLLGLLLFSCGNETDQKNSGLSLNLEHKNDVLQANDTLIASIKNEKNLQIDSIKYNFEDIKIKKIKGNAPATIILDYKKLGNRKIEVSVYAEGEEYKLSKEVKIFSDKKPITYTYEIVETYPHDPKAYTQGLEFYNDTLYESTGQYGRSSLRKVDFSTGEVLSQLDLGQEFFGEGLTILNNKIYQLTWREGKGFVYDVDDFEKTGSFAYNNSKEGWGLANDGSNLYKSDGTEKIWTLNPETLTEEDFIQIVTHNAIVTRMNELEWVEGKIYANTYQKDGVAIINPLTGAIEGLIDFRGLRENLGNVDQLDPQNDVLNGIAYNPNTKKLYVTGKDWDKLFEVKIMEK